MREDDAFDAAYGDPASARIASGLRRPAPDRTPSRDSPAATVRRASSRSLLMARLEVMRPTARTGGRNWRFTD